MGTAGVSLPQVAGHTPPQDGVPGDNTPPSELILNEFQKLCSTELSANVDKAGQEQQTLLCREKAKAAQWHARQDGDVQGHASAAPQAEGSLPPMPVAPGS